MEGPAAIGRVSPDGAWIGFRRTDGDGYELVLGVSHELRHLSTDPELLLAAAIAHFEEALPDAPPDLEATQADVAGLVRYLGAFETDASRARLLAEAVDAVDDGLAGDAVAASLLAAWKGPVDPVEALLERVRDELSRARPAREAD